MRIIPLALIALSLALPASASAEKPSASFGPPVPILNVLAEPTGTFAMEALDNGVVTGSVVSFSLPGPIGRGTYQVTSLNSKGRCVYSIGGTGTYTLTAHTSPLNPYRPLIIVTGSLCDNLRKWPLDVSLKHLDKYL